MAEFIALLAARRAAEINRGIDIEPEIEKERIYHERPDPLELSEREFLANYRLPKRVFIKLLDEIRADLDHESLRGRPVSAASQLLICLHFYATGSIQWVTANDHRHMVERTTVSRIISRVTNSINQRMHRYIKFPSTQEELQATSLGFFKKTKLPGVIGVIDCTHVPIQKPSGPSAHVYLNRKQRYSVNVQLVCDVNTRILDVVAEWPGSTHDASIWANCGLRSNLSSANLDGFWLIGDSGYPLEPWLMRPIANPENQAQERFNYRLCKTRSCIERCNGLFKSTWRALSDYGGNLLYAPAKVCKFVFACAILYNFYLDEGVEMPDSMVEEEQDGPSDSEPPFQPANAQTQARANQILNQLVENLNRQ